MTRRTILITERKLTIPGYTVQELIGKGAMATVYLAQQHTPNRTVALKIMGENATDDPTFCDRFIREGEIVKQLHHQNIVSIYDTGAHQDCYYMAMEYIPDGTLKDRMLRILSPRQALLIFMQIAKALGYAHKKGFVHRDIKPANILFRNPNEAVLSDFGVAKALRSEATQLTAIGWTVGTPGYMSPEQALGQPVDGRSDLYSLGVVLYEMLTGERPYQGADSFSTAMLHISTPIPRLPPRLIAYQGLLDRLLAKSPKERFANADEALAACELMLHTHPSHAAPEDSTVVRRRAMTQTLFKQPDSDSAQPHVDIPVTSVPHPTVRSWRPWLISSLIGLIGVVGVMTLYTAVMLYQPTLLLQMTTWFSDRIAFRSMPWADIPGSSISGTVMNPAPTDRTAVIPTSNPTEDTHQPADEREVTESHPSDEGAYPDERANPADSIAREGTGEVRPHPPMASPTEMPLATPSSAPVPLVATPVHPSSVHPSPVEVLLLDPPPSVVPVSAEPASESPQTESHPDEVPPQIGVASAAPSAPPQHPTEPQPESENKLKTTHSPFIQDAPVIIETKPNPSPVDRVATQPHATLACQKATQRAQQRYARGDWNRQEANDYIRQHCP